MNLRIVLHREIPDDRTLWREWNDLALQMERPEVFYTREWALAVQSAYPSSANPSSDNRCSLRPLLLLGYEGDRLLGVASLATDPSEETVSFLAANTADYCDFLSRPQHRSAFLEAVFAELAKIKLKPRFMALANLPEESATGAALRSAAVNHGFHLYMRPAYSCAQVDLGSGDKCGERSGEKRRQLQAAFVGRKKIRRYLRAMEREGPVAFLHLKSQEQIQRALPAFADAHVARFQKANRISSLSTPERRFFLEELARRFAGSGVVTLSMLTIRDRPVAWNFGFQFHGSWFWYQPTFDSSYEENSPGHCLLSRIIIEACDTDGMNVVDLGLGAEGYKERFANSSRQTLYATVTKSRSRHLQEIVRYRAASALKESPRIELAVRRVLGHEQAGGRLTAKRARA